MRNDETQGATKPELFTSAGGARPPDARPCREYGYGIVDKDGDPWWGEQCVAHDQCCLGEVIESLNEEPEVGFLPRRPYRVVRLLYVEEGA